MKPSRANSPPRFQVLRSPIGATVSRSRRYTRPSLDPGSVNGPWRVLPRCRILLEGEKTRIERYKGNDKVVSFLVELEFFLPFFFFFLRQRRSREGNRHLSVFTVGGGGRKMGFEEMPKYRRASSWPNSRDVTDRRNKDIARLRCK